MRKSLLAISILCLGVTSGYTQAVCEVASGSTTGSEIGLPPESCVPPELSMSDLEKLTADDGKLTWGTSLETAMKDAAESGRQVLVFFTSPACDACTRMQALVFPDSYIQMRLASFELVRLDITKKAAAANDLNVEQAPAVVRLSPEGDVVDRRHGLLSKDDLLSMMRQRPQKN